MGPSILERVTTIVVDHLGVDRLDVTVKASFLRDLSADSLDVIEIAMEVEEEFDLEIPDEDIERVDTVGDLVAYVEKKTSERAARS